MIPRSIPEYSTSWIFSSYINSLFVKDSDTDSIKTLESRLRKFFNSKELFLTSSARVGLYWTLKAISPPRIYLPAYLPSSIYEAVMRSDVPTTYLDCQEGTFEQDLDHTPIEEGSVLLVIHQYGIPVNLKYYREFCTKYGLVMVEDCAPSIGAKWDKSLVGTIGDVSLFSFEYSKAISGCKGGAILFNNKKILKKYNETVPNSECSSLNINDKFWIKDSIIGIANKICTKRLIYGSLVFPLFNSINGSYIDRSKTINYGTDYEIFLGKSRAYLISKVFDRINDIISKREKIAQIYLNLLPPSILPTIPDKAHPVFCHFPVLLPSDKRRSIVTRLNRKGIDVGFNFSYICAGNKVAEECPRSLNYSKRIITLPIYSNLTIKEAHYIAKTLCSLINI